MHRKKVIKKLFVLTVILSFIFAPLRFDNFNFHNLKAEGANNIIISQDTVWKKSDNKIIDKNITIKNGATLTIEKGATITFAGEPIFITVSQGSIIAEGTQEEKITFTTRGEPFWDSYGILFEDSGNSAPSFFRYVEFLNGGYYPYVIFQDKNQGFLSQAYAADYGSGAVEYRSGKVHIENSEFKNSFQGAVMANVYEKDDTLGDNYLEIINSNFENSKYKIALSSSVYSDYGPCKTKVIVKNNWYDHNLGPTFPDVVPQIMLGEKLIGDYEFSGFRDNNLIFDPVIIVPGIMGSETQYVGGLGKLQLDPITHTYANLIASFKKNEYVSDRSLFEFPYEWRKSNSLTAEKLKEKITEVKNETKISKVDLVTHSMGGLVAREYIEDSNRDDVDQLVTLGTPHKGSPEAYLKWEAGEGFFDTLDKVSKAYFKIEAHHAGYNDLGKYIREKVVSAGELLPDYDYLYDVSSGGMRNYPDGYPQTGFLENLNSQNNLNNLDKVDFTNIIGNVSGSDKTIKKFRVVDSMVSGQWEHGMPENFYDTNTDQGIEYGVGDGTVPLSSADGISADKKIEINSGHGDLPTKAQCEIIKELTGKTDCEYVNTFKRITHILTFGVFSPIDIQIVAPDGKRVGKNFADPVHPYDEISGAFYTGHSAENEFVAIPDPQDGEYKILTQGTGEGGAYKIEAAKISEDETNPQIAKESTAEITGNAVPNEQKELKVAVTGDIVENTSQDSTPPIITGSATTQPNAKGWYNQNVVIHFEATDESGVASLTPDAVLTEEGRDQKVVGTATDILGNTASLTVSGINIDKTNPNTDVEILGAKGNNDWYVSDAEVKFSASDNLSGADKTYFGLDGGEYKEENSLIISSEGEHSVKYYSKDLAGNAGAEKEIKIKIDKTAPKIKIISPRSQTYKNDKILRIEYKATDLISSLDKIKTELYFDDQAISVNKIDLSLEHLGAHTVFAIAFDKAGNESEKASVSFESTADVDSIISNVDHYFNLKLITSLKTRLLLYIKLGIIKNVTEALDLFQRKWMPKWSKDRVVGNLKKEINREINGLISDIQYKKNFSEAISQKAKDLLVESLGRIRV